MLTMLLIVALIGTIDSHDLNARYLGWKMGILPFDQTRCMKYIGVDVRFRKSLEGKTPGELSTLFPDLRPASKANAYQRHYNDHVGTQDFLWIGDSGWAMIFKKGKLLTVVLMKG